LSTLTALTDIGEKPAGVGTAVRLGGTGSLAMNFFSGGDVCGLGILEMLGDACLSGCLSAVTA
jgi:hypothetical protein